MLPCKDVRAHAGVDQGVPGCDGLIPELEVYLILFEIMVHAQKEEGRPECAA